VERINFLKSFLFLILLTLFFTHPVRAQDAPPTQNFIEHISQFDDLIKINKDGTINVKETILYDFGNQEKHGIFRYIPYTKKNQDGKKYKMTLSTISVTDENGTPYSFSQSNEDGKITLKVGDAGRFLTGAHTYIISYNVSGALTYFSDHDELYWNVTGNDWKIPLERVTAQVVMPDEVKEQDINGKCYTGFTGSTAVDCEMSKTDHEISFDTVSTLSITEGFTFAAIFPKNIVAVLEPQPVIEFGDTLLGKIFTYGVIGLLGIGSLLWYLIYPLWLPIKWYKQGRDPQKVKDVAAWYDPPKTKTGRFLTPMETGTLIDERADLKDVSGMIIDLARRGHFKIIEKKKNDFYFKKTRTTDDEPLSFEKTFIDDLFGASEEIRLKDEELYEAVKTAQDNSYKNLVIDNFFQENPDKVRKFYIVIFVIAVITLNFPLAVFSLIFGLNMPRRTIWGTEQLGVARGLKNFLSSQERQLAFQADKQLFFEKLLPYAVAFGVEKIWTERFKDIDLKSPDWYQGYYGSNFSNAVFISSLHSSVNQFRTVATPTRSSSGFSSGLSGGGFSGGGGGGGGGGSW